MLYGIEEHQEEQEKGPFYVRTINTFTGKPEMVEVSKEVFDVFRRTGWNIEDNDESFFAHEIQYSSMCNDEMSQVENYRGLESQDPTPEEALFLKQRKQLGLLLLNTLPPVLRKRYVLYHYDGLSDSEIAEIEGISRQAVWQNLQRAQALIEKNRKKYEKI